MLANDNCLSLFRLLIEDKNNFNIHHLNDDD